MDAVLGFATTRTTLGFVVVERLRGGDPAVRCGTFRVHTHGRLTGFSVGDQADAYQHMANRVRLRMHRIAATHRVRSVGVTWSGDAEPEALLLRESLTDAGIGNIFPVGLSDAANALATASGYEETAVCVIEPEMVSVFVPDAHDARNSIRRVPDSADGLIRWLTEIVDRDDWHAEGVIVAGPDTDRDVIASQLTQILPMPVFSSQRTQSALALGAAHASARGTKASKPARKSDQRSCAHSRPWSRSHPRALLLAAVLALAVLLPLGLRPALQSHRPPGPADNPHVANTPERSPAGQPVAPPAAPSVQQVQAPSADSPLAPAPRATPPAPVDVSPPAVSVPRPPANLPTRAPDEPAPQEPATPPPPEFTQVPGPVPDPPTDSAPPSPPDCVLLCRIAI